MPDNVNKTAEAAFAKACTDLLSQGYNNFDLIKIMRIEANKVREARRAARTAKAAAPKAAPKAAAKPAAKPAVAAPKAAAPAAK